MTALVTGTSTHVLRLTAPIPTMVLPHAVGRLLYVVVPSGQVVWLTTATFPPFGLCASVAFATWIRSRAFCTGPERAERSNRRSTSRTGELSATRRVPVPYAVVAVDAST